MKHFLRVVVGLLAGSAGLVAEVPEVASYVAEGLASNLALQARRADVAALSEAIAEARAMAAPEVTFSARVTANQDETAIDLPIGDIINPAYQSLNQLLGQNAFGTIDNQSIVLRNGREQDTRLSLVMPLYQPRIGDGVRARQAEEASGLAQLDAFRRTLRQALVEAYYQWLQASAAVEIFEAARAATVEAERVVSRRAEVGSAVPAEAARARAEVLTVEEQVSRATLQRDQALRYANLLRNASDLHRPLPLLVPTVVEARVASVLGELAALDRAAVTAAAVARREEPAALGAGLRATEAQAQAARREGRPTVGLAVDVGWTGDGYSSNDSTEYVSASVVGQWNLWNGGGGRARTRAAERRADSLRAQQAEAELGIRLEVASAWQTVEVEAAALATARQRLAAANESLRLTQELFNVGSAPQVALIDARTAATAAQLAESNARHGLLRAWAAFERAAALGEP